MSYTIFTCWFTSEMRKNVMLMSQRIIMIHEIWPEEFRGHTKYTFKYGTNSQSVKNKEINNKFAMTRVVNNKNFLLEQQSAAVTMEIEFIWQFMWKIFYIKGREIPFSIHGWTWLFPNPHTPLTTQNENAKVCQGINNNNN